MRDDTVQVHEAFDTPSPGLPEPPMASRAVRAYEVRVELDAAGDDEEISASLRGDLDPDVGGWLRDLEPRVGTTGDGNAAVQLTVPGQDVWTSALTAMAVLRQLGYDPLALHVEQHGHHRQTERPAA